MKVPTFQQSVAGNQGQQSWLVRRYWPGDEASVRHIYAETAFFGDPVEAFFEDRHLFAELGIAPYIIAFPECIFIAEVRGRVVGYALGSPVGDGAIHRVRLRILPQVVLQLATGRYWLGPRALRYFAANLLALLRGELLEVRDPRYPANMHTDVLAPYRGRGIGRGLICCYLEALRAEGVAGVHLVTTDRNWTAIRLYEKLGFRLLAQRATNIWRAQLGQTVFLLAYGLELGQVTHAR